MINFFEEEIDFPSISEDQVKEWIENVIEINNLSVGDLSFIFCNDNYLLEINKEYLQHDYFTDIITFNFCEKDIVSGDIFISVDTVKKNSLEYNTSFINELHRVIIHGVLHLIGFDDTDDELQKEMTEQEDICLELYNKLFS